MAGVGADEDRRGAGDSERRAASGARAGRPRPAPGRRAGGGGRGRRRARRAHPRCGVRRGGGNDRLDRGPVPPGRRRRPCPEAEPRGGRAPPEWPSGRGPPAAAAGPGPHGPARRGRRHRHQPRCDSPNAVAGPDDGRAVIAGQRRRLQGRGPGRERLRAVLPAPHDRGRDGQAGERPDPRDRGRRAPGDRNGPAPGRGREGLRRPAGDARAGRVAGRAVRDPHDPDRRHRRRRLRPRADRRRACGAAGRAERGHRWDGRRHHDGPGPGSEAAGPRDGRRRGPDEARLGHRRHGRLRAGRQLRALEGRRSGGHGQPGDDPRAREPAGVDARRGIAVLRPQPVGPAPAAREGRRLEPRPERRDRGTGQITHGGEIRSEAVRKLLAPQGTAA